MYLLVTYDVSTASPDGAERLHQAVKIYQDYGQRVQNSIFECLVPPAQGMELEAALTDTINFSSDSLRIYHLGTNCQSKITTIGRTKGVDPEGVLLI